MYRIIYNYYKNEENNNVCANCENFIGGGDWGLCCKITYDLCYENTKACDDFKQKSDKSTPR